MNFLAPFTHMPGPVFLVLYAAIFAIFFCVCMLFRSQIDKSDSKEPLSPEPDPAPYRIAYLRGGSNEVLRLAAFELFSQGAIGEDNDGFSKPKRWTAKWKLIPEKFDPALVSTFAREVSQFFMSPRKPTDIFQSNVAVQFSDQFRQWDRWIEDEELKIRPEHKTKFVGIAIALAATFFAIGLAKVLIAISNERYNVGFAIAMMLAGTIAFIAVVSTASIRNLSSRGRAYLSGIQTVNSQHRSLASISNLSSASSKENAAPHNPMGELPVMAMGLFGVAALQASPFDDFRRTYQRSEAATGGCGAASCAAFMGASCGSGTGGGGAGCGGGGGGGCGGCGGGCGGS